MTVSNPDSNNGVVLHRAQTPSQLGMKILKDLKLSLTNDEKRNFMDTCFENGWFCKSSMSRAVVPPRAAGKRKSKIKLDTLQRPMLTCSLVTRESKAWDATKRI